MIDARNPCRARTRAYRTRMATTVQQRWASPPRDKDGKEISFKELMAYVPADIRARAAEARRIDRAGGHRQLSIVDDPYSCPLVHANPCTDRSGKPVYAIWCDGQPVGIASTWPDAAHVVDLLTMHFRVVGPDDLIAAWEASA